MAGYRSDDGAANNGFGRRSLHQWEGRLLYAAGYPAGYPAPPDFRAPGGWRLSAGGVPIPPPPQGAALDAAIDEILEGMSDEQHADPRFYLDNYPAWNTFFRQRYERELAAYDGPPLPPTRNNASGRRRWWSAPGRTLEAVLAHIERENSPVLGMTPPQPPTLSRRHGSSWMPRRMASRSSGSASSGSASARSASRSSVSTPRTVKQEPPSAPPRRSSGALVIREGARTSSPPRNRKRKPRKDDAKAASELADVEAAHTEEVAMREAIAKSLADLVPADNAMPMEAALAWSRQDWEREQAKQQQRLLNLAQVFYWPEVRRSSSWKTPATMTCIGRRRRASATLDRGPTVGPPARAASRRRRTMTAATTRISTAISAYRTRVFSLG
jgi:hypothetical protein